ncbi:MAG: hypothetical protein NTW21_08455 [Verrucomicrobia bacterium]|nr:hypothetical protein [Verrucomicrobiota bacterium]
MDKEYFESCERRNEPATPVAADQAASTGGCDVAGPVACRLGAATRSGRVHRRQRETSEVLWHETCRPGGLPCLRLPPALVWVVFGCGAALLAQALLVARGSPPILARAPVAPAPMAIRQPPGPRSTQALLGADDPYAHAIKHGMYGEAGWDLCAQLTSAARRVETEHRLAQSDVMMVLKLDEWREPLADFLDLIVEAAGVGTSGGTWVGHESNRNDLNLESELLGVYAETLCAVRPDDAPSRPADPEELRKRTDEWQILWVRFEAMVRNLRQGLPKEDPFSGYWKQKLRRIQREALRVHGSLSVMLGNLEDDATAAAVTDFCSGYLSATMRQGGLNEAGTPGN